MTRAENVRKAGDAINAAAGEQWAAEPHHTELGALLLAADHVLDALETLNSNIGLQLAGYQQGNALQTVTAPAQVIAAAIGQGRAVDIALLQARGAVRAMADECAQLTIPAKNH